MVSLGYHFAHFGGHRNGSQESDPVFTESIDFHLFNLAAQIQVLDVLRAGFDLPIGTLNVVPFNQEEQIISGLGDVSLHVATNSDWIFQKGKKWPSLALEAHLLLPTAASKRTEESPGTPPNLIALGYGSLGSRVRLKSSQHVLKKLALFGRVEWIKPWQANGNGLTIGALASAALGAETKPHDGWMASGEFAFEHRAQTVSESVGTIINSGGQRGILKGLVSYSLSPRLNLGINGHLPVYNNVNGQQIVQSWGIGLSLGGMFETRKNKDVSTSGNHEEDNKKSEVHTHEEIKELTPQQPKQVEEFRSGGKSFDLKEASVPGHWVVVDYWAEWCAPCKDTTAMLVRKASSNPRLKIKKVEVPSFDSDVAKEHLVGVKGLPVVWLIDPNGKLVKKFESVDQVTLEESLDEMLNK